MPSRKDRREQTAERTVARTTGLMGVVEDRAMLIVLVGKDAGKTHVIGNQVTIGRDAEADIQIVEDDVSREHAKIIRKDKVFYFRDLKSRNGSLVNGIPTSRQVLSFGDKIRVSASTIFLFCKYDPLEDQLLQSQRLETIGQMASGVAHDFNNYLGAGLGNLSYLNTLSKDIPLGHPEIQECLQEIDGALQKAVELNKQLMSLSRQDDQEQSRLDLKEVVLEVAAMLKRIIPKHIRIEVQALDGVHICGNSLRLHQLLTNLCINARDAMPHAGTLSISAEKLLISGEDSWDELLLPAPGEYAVLKVSDTGMGMSRKVRQQAFEPFFTTKEKGRGTGLGLATVFHIVKNHGGKIDLASEVGVGTRFTIYLPLAEGEAGALVPAPGVQSHNTMKVTTGLVLVVDDDSTIRRLATRLLEALGYPVICAKDGIDAVQVFSEHRDLIKLVVLDLNMPQMGGADTFDALRMLDPGIKVLLCSGSPDTTHVQRLMDAGVNGYLPKPFDMGSLSKAISEVLFPEDGSENEDP